MDGEPNGLGNRRSILRYYMHTFTNLLTTNLENNCFLSGACPHQLSFPPGVDRLMVFSSILAHGNGIFNLS